MARRRHNRFSWTSVIPIAVIVALVVAFIAMKVGESKGSADPVVPSESGTYDLLDVKTHAGVSEEIIDYRGMRVSFNPDKHVPNWVSWELTGDEADGTEPRGSKFVADPKVAGCAQPYDYNNSGFDRGHMAPAGDMKWSADAMGETFYMTNICPQRHALNSGAWKSLEEKCRARARVDSAIVIVCGPVFRTPPVEYIGDTRVAVPEEFFKVIISPYSEQPRGIGFIMPNGKVAGGMQPCAMSIDEVERITGYDFFHELPDDIEAEIESQCNFHLWSRMK